MEACERPRWCLGTTTKPTCNVNRLLGATGHTAVSALQLGELDQGLALEGHHHHVTTRHEQQRELPVTQGWTSSCSGSGGPRVHHTELGQQTQSLDPRRRTHWAGLLLLSPYGSKLLQSIDQVCFHHSLAETSDVHHGAGRDPVGLSIAVLQHTR